MTEYGRSYVLDMIKNGKKINSKNLHFLKTIGVIKNNRLPITKIKRKNGNLEIVVVPKVNSLTVDYKTLKYKLGNSFITIKSKRLKNRISNRLTWSFNLGISIFTQNLLSSKHHFISPGLIRKRIFNQDISPSEFLLPFRTTGDSSRRVMNVQQPSVMCHNPSEYYPANINKELIRVPISSERIKMSDEQKRIVTVPCQTSADRFQDTIEVPWELKFVPTVQDLELTLYDHKGNLINKMQEHRDNLVTEVIKDSVKPLQFKYLENLSDVLNKTITEIYTDNDTYLIFKLDTEEYLIMYHSQDCCENVNIEDINGELKNLIGKPLIRADVKSSDKEDGTDLTKNERDELDGDTTYTFYTFATINGYVDIRWYGESNGYYSTAVSLALINSVRSYKDILNKCYLDFDNKIIAIC